MSDYDKTVFARYAKLEQERERARQQVRGAEERWRAVQDVLSRIEHFRCGEDDDNRYAGLLIEYCRAVREVSGSIHLPNLTPANDGAQLALDVLRFAIQGDKATIVRILEGASSAPTTLGALLVTNLIDLLRRTIGGVGALKGDWVEDEQAVRATDQEEERTDTKEERIDQRGTTESPPDESNSAPRASEHEYRVPPLDLILDLNAHTVRRGEAMADFGGSATAWKMFLTLCRRCPAYCPKKELFSEVWENGVVEDGTLYAQKSTMQKILQPLGIEGWYKHGVGYGLRPIADTQAPSLEHRKRQKPRPPSKTRRTR
jgi:hypothetical protein